MKRFIFKFIHIGMLVYLTSFGAFASPNYCIIGDNATDCSYSGVDLTYINTGILNTGDILGDNPSGAWWAGIFHNGTPLSADPINGITNDGTITGWVNGIGIWGSAVISGGITNNSGATISGFRAIETEPASSINFINNAGSITGFNQNSSAGPSDIFSGILNAGTIGEITNTGTISSTRNLDVSFGILNNGSITTLNNSQGASALTYSGNLPNNYNIIINSPTNFGKLAVSGATGNMIFNIHNTSTVAVGTYASILTGLTLSNLAATSGSYSGFNWTLLNTVGTTWDLVFSSAGHSGPSSSDTQSSLTTLSKNLRSSFNATLMSSNYANMNTYDCNLFDKNNMCISAGGRVTTIDNPSSHHSAAVVVLGYKVSPHIRIGGFLDQSVNHNMPSGVDMSNKNPMMGAFLVWNHQADSLGFQMKLANAYLDKDVTTLREVIGTSEAGRGRTDLNTQSYVGELSYAFNYQDSTIVRSYFALRHTRIKQDGYTEETTSSVTAPLTYAKLSDRSTTALMGVKLNHALTPRANLTASLGIEQDLDHKVDQLSATGVSGLTSENFYNNIRHTRPVASLGAYYAVAKNQRLSGDIYYQQLPFQSTDSTTAYFNYMIGF